MASVGDGTGHSGMPKGTNAATMRPSGPQGSEKGGKGPVLVKGGNRSMPLGGGKK